jgi:hypothetical protein
LIENLIEKKPAEQIQVNTRDARPEIKEKAKLMFRSET